MRNQGKTKQQLINELMELLQRINILNITKTKTRWDTIGEPDTHCR